MDSIRPYYTVGLPLILLGFLTAVAHTQPWRQVDRIPASHIAWKGFFMGKTAGDDTRIYSLMAQGYLSWPGLGGPEFAAGLEKRIAVWFEKHPDAWIIPVEAYPFFSPSSAFVYSWAIDGEANLNIRLVQEGYCRANVMLPVLQSSDLLVSSREIMAFRQKLAAAERVAAQAKRGIWARPDALRRHRPGSLSPPGQQELATLERKAASAPIVKPTPNYGPKTPEDDLIPLAYGDDNAASYVALKELVRRAASNSLSPDAFASLIATGLDRQGDSERTWRSYYGTLLRLACQQGQLTEKQLDRYVRQAVVPRISVSLIPWGFQRVRFQIEVEQRAGVSDAPLRVKDEREPCLYLSAGYRITNVKIDREPATVVWMGGMPLDTWWQQLRGGVIGAGFEIRPSGDLTPGSHKLTGKLEIQIHQGTAVWNAVFRGKAPKDVPPPIAIWSLEIERQFTLPN